MKGEIVMEGTTTPKNSNNDSATELHVPDDGMENAQQNNAECSSVPDPRVLELIRKLQA